MVQFRPSSVSVSTKNSSVGVRVTELSVNLKRQTFSEPAGAVLPHFLSLDRPNLMNQNRLFVGNLSYQTSQNDLQDYFAQAGAVNSVNLMLSTACRHIARLLASPPRPCPIISATIFLSAAA